MKRRLIILFCLLGLFTGILGNPDVSAKKKIRLNYKSCVIKVGKTKQLKIKGKVKKKPKWKSFNKKIATVNQKGVVKGKKTGKVKISAKVGKLKAICHVTIKNSADNKVSPTPKPTATPYPTPPSISDIEKVGGETGKVLNISSVAISVSLDGSDEIQMDIVLTEDISYTIRGVPCSLNEVRVGDWINFDYTLGTTLHPSTVYGCPAISILGR